MKTKLLPCLMALGIFCLSFPIKVEAQTIQKPWAIGVGIVGRDFESLPDGSINDPEILPAFHTQLERFISKSFNLGLQGGFAPAKNNSGAIQEDLTDFDLLLKWKIANGGYAEDGVRIIPILQAGLGGGYTGSENPFNFHIPIGLGFRFQLGPGASIDLMGNYKASLGELGNYVTLHGGVNVGFGKGKDSQDEVVPLSLPDTDGDGVVDNIDECPSQAGLAEFNGCPDTDGDGIADKDDRCPEVAGLLSLQGCPEERIDTDGDGIPDDQDECPAVAGLATFNGCPDTDGDGIIDKEDACPDIAGLKEYQGCPDTDGDGIPDNLDECPAVAGLATLGGCPDSDGDGIKDSEDRCPDEPGTVELKGCPEIEDKVITQLATVTKSVQFQSGSAILKSSSKPVLDQIVKIMNDYPAYSLRISGYTDSTGDDKKNLSLSKSRAAACQKYLKDNGLDNERMESDGFGEADPIGDNSTSFGRSQNRRVEFELFVK